MIALLHSFTSPEWTLVVKALLHTLWLGGVTALLLALTLRFCANPIVRYRVSLAALAVVMVSGLVTWAVLDHSLNAPVSKSIAPPPAFQPTTGEVTGNGEPSDIVIATTALIPAPPAPSSWTAWLALLWLAGALAMLLRAGMQVAGAERLRRSSRAIDDPGLNELLAQARRAIGIVRTVRVAVTERLTSPAVVGVLVPTLILPLSLMTTLTHEQIRFILLHELAHIRRGDYLANLFQLFAEALLFFNPAVWWISHQIRREREVCCDALAIELSGAPAEYARTLVHVAESSLNPVTAAPAFGNGHEPSSLSDRIQRLLVPGYRPALRLTWRAMLASLFLGSVLLVLSAVGTRVTLAAAVKLLTPQERIERIEKKMTEYGAAPEALSLDNQSDGAQYVEISGTVRTADGAPLPSWVPLTIHSFSKRSSINSANRANEGSFKHRTRQGEIYVSGELTNYAPAIIGPFDAIGSNQLENLELVFERGFDVQAVAVDEETGKPLVGATLNWQFWLPNGKSGIFNRGEREARTDLNGAATLTHCSDLPLDLILDAPDYEFAQKRFDTLKPGQVLRISTRRGAATTGTVLDKARGTPIQGATIQLFHQNGRGTSHGYGWNNQGAILTSTDHRGAFVLRQLRRDTRYWLAVTAPGRESAILNEVQAGQSNLAVRLGPELVVRGRIVGDLKSFLESNGKKTIAAQILESEINGQPSMWTQQINLELRDGVGYFEFTNRIAGPAKIIVAGHTFERIVDSPVNDWLVDLAEIEDAPKVAQREVIFRFKGTAGIPLKGVVSVTIPDNLDPRHLTAHSEEIEIENNEVRAQIAVGGRTSIEPKQTIGFWFKDYHSSIEVTNGSGPLIVEVPVIPAGAIYAQARNADGTSARNIFFSIVELKPSPRRDTQGSLSGGVNSPTTKYVSGALPLDGTYQVVGWRDNAFCISRPIKLTEEKPDAEVTLEFAPGKTLAGRVLDADGKPVRNMEVNPHFAAAENRSFGLKPVFTDDTGHFELANTTPDAGEYSVKLNAPRLKAELVKLKPGSRPQVIRLQRGKILAGRILEAGTGRVIPNAEVRAADFGTFKLPRVTTRTDANGRFEFTTLGDTSYKLFVDEGQWLENRTFQPDADTNLVLTIKLYEWSRLRSQAAGKPKPALDLSSNKPAETNDVSFRDSKNGPIEILADNTSFDAESGLLTASNNVVWRHRDIVIHADRAAVNRESGELNATGNVVLENGDSRTTGDSLRYNSNTGTLSLSAPSGERLRVALDDEKTVNRATAPEIDEAEKLIQEPITSPQINIKTKFALIPEANIGEFFRSVGITNSSIGNVSVILSSTQYSNTLSVLERRHDANLIHQGEVTTLSGRQAQIQFIDVMFVPTNINPRALAPPGIVSSNGTSDLFQFAQIPQGQTLDVLATARKDGKTIALKLAATLTEFLGYKKGETRTAYIDGGETQATVPKLDIRVREMSSDATIWDGQTVVLLGPPAESEKANTRKNPQDKRLIAFVTATLISPTGERINPELNR